MSCGERNRAATEPPAKRVVARKRSRRVNKFMVGLLSMLGFSSVSRMLGAPARRQYTPHRRYVQRRDRGRTSSARKDVGGTARRRGRIGTARLCGLWLATCEDADQRRGLGGIGSDCFRWCEFGTVIAFSRPRRSGSFTLLLNVHAPCQGCPDCLTENEGHMAGRHAWVAPDCEDCSKLEQKPDGARKESNEPD